MNREIERGVLLQLRSAQNTRHTSWSHIAPSGKVVSIAAAAQSCLELCLKAYCRFHTLGKNIKSSSSSPSFLLLFVLIKGLLFRSKQNSFYIWCVQNKSNCRIKTPTEISCPVHFKYFNLKAWVTRQKVLAAFSVEVHSLWDFQL